MHTDRTDVWRSVLTGRMPTVHEIHIMGLDGNASNKER